MGSSASLAPTVVVDDRQGVVVDGERFARLLADVLVAEGAVGPGEASLIFVDEAEIADLNGEFLDGDGPTDVLSFPLDPFPADAAVVAETGDAGAARLIGDVIVCPSVAQRQAGDHAGMVDDEIALLVLHAGLHLCGWDHADDDERRAMWRRERELMTLLWRVPTRDPWVAV